MKNNTKSNKNNIEYTYIFTVNKSDLLLPFLLSKINNSRNVVKGLLSKNMVLVNGNVTRQFDYPLSKDDIVKVSKHPITNSKNNTSDFDVSKYIIYEDDNYIAFNKPSGLLSIESDNDNESIYKYVSIYLSKEDKKNRPYILHRIDKETSGIILFTKKIELHSKLKMHWNEDVKLREYYALVEGTFKDKKGTIKTYLKENDNHLIYSTKDPNGKLAITNYEVVKENSSYSLLKINIETGRKNQIRVHMKDLGHQIVGDIKYGNKNDVIGRLGLHASTFIFFDPLTNKEIKITSPVPKEFYKVFKNE